ncbi:MAG: energy-coupling factor transport system permease protein [Clostridia bacterium]|nr:energy-coupling factor transport system permease protein [Clostridia bacterium]
MFIYAIALLIAPTGAAALVVGLIILLPIIAARLELIFIWRQLRPLIIFLFFVFIFQAVFTPGSTLAFIGPVKITYEGVNLGLLAFVRVVFLVLAATVLTATTAPMSVADGLERLLSPGEKLGLPAHELALMLTLALRFVPTLMGEAERIIKAQMARGASFRGTQIKNLLPLIIPLFISAFRRAEALAEAMESRAYHGGKGRTRMRELKLKTADFLFLVITIFLLAGSLYYRYGI